MNSQLAPKMLSEGVYGQWCVLGGEGRDLSLLFVVRLSDRPTVRPADIPPPLHRPFHQSSAG